MNEFKNESNPCLQDDFEILNTFNDFWSNPVQVMRKGTSNSRALFIDKTYTSPHLKMESDKKDLLSKIVRGLNHAFLQSAGLKEHPDLLNIIFQFDAAELKSYVEYSLKKKRLISENQLLVICKGLIDLGALFENYFCFIPEVTLKSMKVFALSDETPINCGVRLQNPFFNDDFLAEIVAVI
jgi:hypothetical protein